jgi:3-hydroxyisobutyrate dehydrogenase-like beta-hydroxyacid dehydrogenase
MSQVAVLGNGLLGSGFAIKAVANGNSVRVWNRTASKCAPLVALGAVQGSDPADAVAGCERVHLVLKADDAVDQVIEALKPGLAPGAWIVDHSTNLPERVAERCHRLRSEGVQYIHAPVFMGPSNSKKGTGQMLISGPSSAIEQLTPALEEMTGTLSVVGPRDQDAAVRKILGNGLIIGLSALAGDLLKAGRAGGFDDAMTLKSLGAFSPMSERMGRRVAGHHAMEATFELAMARKDIGLLVETVGSQGLSVLPGLAEAMDALIQSGHGQDNYTVVAAN